MITKEEIKTVVSLLKKLDEKELLPFDVFMEVTRLSVSAICEIVPLRLNQNGEIEIWLIQREANDPIWPNMWHTPGTVVRPSDINLEMACKRVIEKELGSVKTGSGPEYIKTIYRHSGRGMELSVINWLELLEDPKDGEWCVTSNLPKNMAAGQDVFILETVENFRKFKG